MLHDAIVTLVELRFWFVRCSQMNLTDVRFAAKLRTIEALYDFLLLSFAIYKLP